MLSGVCALLLGAVLKSSARITPMHCVHDFGRSVSFGPTSDGVVVVIRLLSIELAKAENENSKGGT